jgi:hypothetical protein
MLGFERKTGEKMAKRLAGTWQQRNNVGIAIKKGKRQIIDDDIG